MTERRWPTVVRHLALYAAAAFFLMPVYVLLGTALKNPVEVSVTRMWELPESLSLHGFSVAWPKLAGGFGKLLHRRLAFARCLPSCSLAKAGIPVRRAIGFVGAWRSYFLRGRAQRIPPSVDRSLHFDDSTRNKNL